MLNRWYPGRLKQESQAMTVLVPQVDDDGVVKERPMACCVAWQQESGRYYLTVVTSPLSRPRKLDPKGFRTYGEAEKALSRRADRYLRHVRALKAKEEAGQWKSWRE